MRPWNDVLEAAMREKGYASRDEFNLDELQELARGHKITPSERAEQRISGAYGMLPFSNTTVTREDIERAAAEIFTTEETVRRRPHGNTTKRQAC